MTKKCVAFMECNSDSVADVSSRVVLGGFSRSPSYRCIKWAWLENFKSAKMLVDVMMMLVLSQQEKHTKSVNK